MFSTLRLAPALLFLALVGQGCAGPTANQGAASPEAEYREVEVDRVVVSSSEALNAFDLVTRGKASLAAGRVEEAARDFELVLSADADGPWTEEVLFLAGRAHEERGDHARAADRFEAAGRRFPAAERSRESLLRALRLLVYLEAWQQAGQLAEHFRALHKTLLPREQLVVTSALALAVLEREGASPEGRAEASALITGARTVIDRYRLDGAGPIPRDLAQVYYALGELRRLEGERLNFDPLPPDFADVFERRARLLLDAQSAYSDVMRAHDAHWTAMAGFRVAELYHKLHEDVMSAPRPPGAAESERRRLVFEAALRLRYSVLLKKGLTMIEHTIAMASRTGERSAWVQRAEAVRDSLRAALNREQEAIDASPYTQEDIERVLAELADRSRE